METLFDWSEVSGQRGDHSQYINEDGTIDWRLRCLHLAEAADALQLAAIHFLDHDSPMARQMEQAGNEVFGHLDYLRADLQTESAAVQGDWQPTDAEVERITPALLRLLAGLRSDNPGVTLLLAVADAIHDSSAEVGEDASAASRSLRSLARRWERDSL